MRKIILFWTVLYLLGCSNGSYRKSNTQDTLDVVITDDLHIKSVFFDGQKRIQYFERNKEFDGQRVEYDSIGNIIRYSYYTMGRIMSFETFYYTNKNLDSSTITNYTSDGADICCRAKYKSNKLITGYNSQYFTIKPRLGNLGNDSVITITKYGEKKSIFIPGDYENGMFLSFGDTIPLEDSVSFLDTKQAPWFYPIRGEVLFLSPLKGSKHIIEKRVPISTYFYKL